jgi:hypothetical protein
LNKHLENIQEERTPRKGSEEPHQEEISNKVAPATNPPRRSHLGKHPKSKSLVGSSEENLSGEALY